MEEANRVVYSDGIDSESGGLDTFLYRWCQGCGSRDSLPRRKVSGLCSLSLYRGDCGYDGGECL